MTCQPFLQQRGNLFYFLYVSRYGKTHSKLGLLFKKKTIPKEVQTFALVDDPPEEEDKNECQELFPLTVYLMIFKLCIENTFLVDVYQKEILPCDFKRSGFIQFFLNPI